MSDKTKHYATIGVVITTDEKDFMLCGLGCSYKIPHNSRYYCRLFDVYVEHDRLKSVRCVECMEATKHVKWTDNGTQEYIATLGDVVNVDGFKEQVDEIKKSFGEKEQMKIMPKPKPTPKRNRKKPRNPRIVIVDGVETISANEAAKILNISLSSISRYSRMGILDIYRHGLLYRYSEKQVNDLVSKNIKEVARNIVYCMAIKIPNTKGYMKVKDAAEYLGVQDSSIYDRIKVGHTKKYMYEGITYISFADIEKYETQLKLRGR